MRIVHLIILFSNFGLLTCAQDSSTVLNKYDQRTIYQYGNKYMLNENLVNAKYLGDYLSKFDKSSLHFSQYKKLNRKAAIYRLLSLGVYVAGLSLIGRNNDLALAGVGTGLLLNFSTAMPLSNTARKHLQKSIWLYNREVLR